MARRRQQQYRRRPAPTARVDDGLADSAMNAAAGRLAAAHTLEELRILVTRSREANDWADQQAQHDPGPEALRRFRAAAQSLAEAERALALALTRGASEGESERLASGP